MAAPRFDPAFFFPRCRNAIEVASVLSLLASFGGCVSGSSPTAPQAAATEAPTIAPDQLVGKWGLAAYREEKDIARTEVEAKAACGNPYVIGQGTAGGIVMHLADQPDPTELAIKRVDGRNFIGPASAPAGGMQDREITSFTTDTFITKWVDPSVANRYGVMIYARCGAAA